MPFITFEEQPDVHTYAQLYQRVLELIVPYTHGNHAVTTVFGPMGANILGTEEENMRIIERAGMYVSRQGYFVFCLSGLQATIDSLREILRERSSPQMVLDELTLPLIASGILTTPHFLTTYPHGRGAHIEYMHACRYYSSGRIRLIDPRTLSDPQTQKHGVAFAEAQFA